MSFPQRSPQALLDEGRHARDRGEACEANPYPPGSEEHDAWRQGWEGPDRERGTEPGSPVAAG